MLLAAAVAAVGVLHTLLNNRHWSYSHLSATIGSTRMARLDGSHAAISAMARNKSEIPANETLSTVLNP